MTTKFILRQRLNNKEIVNTLHYLDVPGETALTPQEVADQIAIEFNTHAGPLMSTDWTLYEIAFVDPDAGGGQPAVILPSVNLPVVGQTPTPSMSNRTTVLINWQCANNAPWRGRTNISGVSELGMDNGNVFQADVQAGINALASNLQDLTDGNGARAKLVIWSGGTDTIVAGTTSDVTSYNVNPSPKTIRSRS